MRKLLKSNSIKKIFLLNGFIIIFILILSPSAYAVNGDILIGIGPISRSLGGTGIAAPQDPISAVFANPAAMCFSPYCPRSEFNLTSTVFMPSTRAAVEVQNMFRIEAKSKSNLFLIPAVGISSPLNQKWRFGFAAYGISGMGVDYRYRLDINPSDPGFQGDIFTKYAALKAAPNIAYMFNDNFSVGASIHINYATLDLGDDNSDSIGIGLQIGSIYKTSFFRFGFSYISPQKLNHKKVSDFDMDSIKDDLKLYIPQIAGFGVAFEPTKSLLLEVNTKWINWKDAKGYKDFDWKDQWVYAFGIQYKLWDSFTLRTGFNYGKNPVNSHNRFDSMSFTKVQGKNINTFQYEYLRIIGFPAITEKHISVGVGYCTGKDFALNIGYTHGFKKKITEKGLNFGGVRGMSVNLSSEIKINTFEFGLSYRF